MATRPVDDVTPETLTEAVPAGRRTCENPHATRCTSTRKGPS
jgi:hypothetical protein